MTGTGAAVRELAGYADEYQTRVFDDILSDYDLTRSRLPEADPITSLRFFFRLYAFNRQGAPRSAYAESANAALDSAAVGQEIDPDELWRGFETRCRRADVGVNSRCTRGVVRGSARLVNREGNLFQWVGREVDDHGRVTVPYDDLTSLDGIGTKIATFFLRDAVWVCGVEDRVRAPDQRRLQSMTTWVRDVAAALWPRLAGADEAVLAKRIVDACADESVSAVEFNQGAWYFGREVVGDRDDIEDRVRELSEK